MNTRYAYKYGKHSKRRLLQKPNGRPPGKVCAWWPPVLVLRHIAKTRRFYCMLKPGSGFMKSAEAAPFYCIIQVIITIKMAVRLHLRAHIVDPPANG